MSPKSLLPSLWDRENLEPFKSLHRDIDRVFDSFTESMPWAVKLNGDSGSWQLTPKIDVGETDTALEITAELPGVDEKDIDVTVTDDILTIKGEKKAEKEDKGKDYHVVERSYGAFQRTLRLPYKVDSDTVEAKFDRGILQITLPKPPEVKSKTRKIEVKAAA